MNKYFEALYGLTSALGDLEIGENGFPIMVLTGDRGKRFKIVEEGLKDHEKLSYIIDILKSKQPDILDITLSIDYKDYLKRIKGLREDWILTEEEYNQVKERLLPTDAERQ